MSEVKVYILSDKEVHMIGSCVGVIWNIYHRPENKKIMHEGTWYFAEIQVNVKEGEPYIDFVNIRYDERLNEHWADDDTLCGQGLTAKIAREVAQELEWAANYIEQVRE